MAATLVDQWTASAQPEGELVATSLSQATHPCDTPAVNEFDPEQPNQQHGTSDATDQLRKMVDELNQNRLADEDVVGQVNSLGKDIALNETQQYCSDDPKFKLFAECRSQSCKFELRNDPVGREWAKALANDETLKESYTQAKSRKAKENVRSLWVERKYDELRHGKTHEREWQKVDVTKGKYLNFGLLVESFGVAYDKHVAILAATRHAHKCLEMKGAWLSYDGMAELPLFLKLEIGFQERMGECWRMWEQESSGPGASALPWHATGGRNQSNSGSGNPGKSSGNGAGNAGAGAGAGDGTHGDTPHSKATSKKRVAEAGAGTHGSTTNHKTPKKADKVDDTLKKALTAASDAKNLYSQAVSCAENLVDIIDSTSSWAWARTPQSIGVLRQLISDLKLKMTDKAKQFLLEDLKDLKRQVGSESLLLIAQDFQALTPILESIEEKRVSLVKAHKSMVSQK